MEYNIMLSNGITIRTDIKDIGVIEDVLANDKVRALTVGNMSISKNAINAFEEVLETGNVELLTRDGKVTLVQDDAYDASAYTAKVNSGSQFIRFGGTIIQNHNYFMAKSIENQTLSEHP